MLPENTISTPTQKPVILKDKAININTESINFSSFVSTQTTDSKKEKNYILHRNDSEKPLIHRLRFCFPEFLDQIFFKSLGNILIFRLLSKDTHSLCSIFFMPFANCVTFSLKYQDLYPKICLESEFQKKYNFATQNQTIELQIINEIATFKSDHLKLLSHFSEINITNPTILILNLTRCTELLFLETIIQDPNYSNSLKLIKKIDFSTLFIDATDINTVNSILTEIHNKLAYFTNLKTISFGKVCPNVSIQVPESIQNNISYIEIEEPSILTVENVVKVGILGFVFYKAYKWIYPDPDDTKKDKK